jgi:hypothetical protein
MEKLKRNSAGKAKLHFGTLTRSAYKTNINEQLAMRSEELAMQAAAYAKRLCLTGGKE